MSFEFSRDLPQSSLMSQDEESLNIDKFVRPPRTLYDEIGQGEQDAYITAKVHNKKKNSVQPDGVSN